MFWSILYAAKVGVTAQDSLFIPTNSNLYNIILSEKILLKRMLRYFDAYINSYIIYTLAELEFFSGKAVKKVIVYKLNMKIILCTKM
jgi:hypothetical protein